jgi:hypothetical protein
MSRSASFLPRLPGAVVILAVAVALLYNTGAGWPQSGKHPTATDHLSSLKIGQWIQLDGTVKGESSAWCTEVKQLAGDFLDDDWSIQGAVQAVDPGRQEFTIGGCHIQVNASTTYEDPHHKTKGLHDLRPGMLLDVEGTFLRTGTLLAAEVDDETDELTRRPQLKDLVEIVGRIEKLDTKLRRISVMGVQFELTDKTKLRSAVQ